MLRLRYLGKKEDFTGGNLATVEVEGKKLSVVTCSGEIFVFDEACPHRGYSLEKNGVVTGCEVLCNKHFYRYLLQTGECVFPDQLKQNPLKKYPVVEVGDDIFVEIEEVVQVA